MISRTTVTGEHTYNTVLFHMSALSAGRSFSAEMDPDHDAGSYVHPYFIQNLINVEGLHIVYPCLILRVGFRSSEGKQAAISSKKAKKTAAGRKPAAIPRLKEQMTA